MNQKPIDLVQTAIITDDELSRVSPLLADLVKNLKLSACKEIISQIKKIIKGKKYPPPQKLRALKLLNSCMLVGNVNFLTFAQKKVMSRFAILASHKKEYTPEQRGESLFGKDSANSIENRTASTEFVTLLLECIKTWAGEFGKAPDKSDSTFYTTYMSLKEKGVKFPVKQHQARISVKEEKKLSIPRRVSVKENVTSILKQFEEIDDEAFYADFVAILEEQQRDLEIAIQEAVNNNNEQEIDVLMGLSDKVNIAISRSRLKKPNKSEFRTSSQSSPYKSQISEKSPQFDIFDLAIEPTGKFEPAVLPNNKASAFATHQPIVKPQNNNSFFPKVNEKQSFFPPVQKSPEESFFPRKSIPQEEPDFFPNPRNFNEEPSVFPQKTGYSEGTNFFPVANRKSIETEDPRIAVLTLENSQLKEALEFAKTQMQERDLALMNMSKVNAELVSQKDQLHLSLSEAKKKIERLEIEVATQQEVKKTLEIDFSSKPSNKPSNVVKEAPKVYEKKSTFDFDLDFILSPGQGNKPAETNAIPKLFDDSSSSDEYYQQVPEVVPVVENDLYFRMGNCMEMGVLLDNEFIQVGFQIKRQASEIYCMVFVGNKASDPIYEVITELSEVPMEALPCLIQPIKTSEEMPQNAQTTRMIKAQFCDFTNKVPKLNVMVKGKSIQQYSIKLPITITRFIELRQELPTSIWIEWKKLVFEEDTSVIQLATFASIVEMCSYLCFGGAFRIYTKQEIEELNDLQVIAAGQLAEVLIMFSVTVLQQGSQANFCIRCRNLALRGAVASLVKMQVSR